MFDLWSVIVAFPGKLSFVVRLFLCVLSIFAITLQNKRELFACLMVALLACGCLCSLIEGLVPDAFL